MSSQVQFASIGTFETGQRNPQLLGSTRIVEDKEYNVTGRDARRFSSMEVTVRWVRNGHNAALAARTPVSFLDTAFGTVVVPAADNGNPAGVVDPWITASVPVNGYFWIFQYGPAQIVTNGAATLPAGQIVVPAGSGKVKRQVAAPADATAALVQVNAKLGYMLEALAATDGLTGRVFLTCSN